jgi:hypothetical protein
MYLLVVLQVLLGVAVPTLLAFETQAFEARIASLTEQGRNVIAFQSSDPNTTSLISRASCEGLASKPGVVAAGLLIPAGSVDVSAVGDSIPLLRASSTLIPQLGEAAVVIGASLTTPSSKTQEVIVNSNASPISAVVGLNQPAGIGTNSALVIGLTARDRWGAQCLVRLQPYAEATTITPALESTLVVSGAPISALPALQEPDDPVAEFLQRADRFFPLLLGLVGGISMVISLRLQGSEVAVYRLAGTSSRSILLLIALQATLVSGVGALAGAAASVVLSAFYPDPSVPILWSVAMGAVSAIAVVALSVDLAFRRPTDLAKDR